MKVCELIEYINGGRLDDIIEKVYVDKDVLDKQKSRYIESLKKYVNIFGDDDVEIYSTPGRSEVCGNHTDHQKGMVIASSINLDAIAIVSRKDDCIRIQSDDYPIEEINLNDISDKKEYGTTKALIKGVIAGLKDKGYKIGGFNAYVTSDVLVGAGMSSSAAFEGLIGTIISGLYNNMSIDSTEIAKVGQYAENVYFGKPCGLMDQMACSVGGLVYIDFEDKEKPVIKKIECDFEKAGLSLCIVDTKGSHADLTDDYAAIPAEMKSVAGIFGKEYLREVDEEEFYASIDKVKEAVSDRAVLRSIHFFEEESRVLAMAEALEKNDYEKFLNVVEESGMSSMINLQNIYSSKNPLVQSVGVAISLSKVILKGKGVCRVHGGGFAGTIQAFVTNDYVDTYKNRIEKVFGDGSCHVLKVRPYGGIKII